MLNLPVQLKVLILSFLDIRYIKRYLATCKQEYELDKNARFWKELYLIRSDYSVMNPARKYQLYYKDELRRQHQQLEQAINKLDIDTIRRLINKGCQATSDHIGYIIKQDRLDILKIINQNCCSLIRTAISYQRLAICCYLVRECHEKIDDYCMNLLMNTSSSFTIDFFKAGLVDIYRMFECDDSCYYSALGYAIREDNIELADLLKQLML